MLLFTKYVANITMVRRQQCRPIDYSSTRGVQKLGIWILVRLPTHFPTILTLALPTGQATGEICALFSLSNASPSPHTRHSTCSSITGTIFPPLTLWFAFTLWLLSNRFLTQNRAHQEKGRYRRCALDWGQRLRRNCDLLSCSCRLFKYSSGTIIRRKQSLKLATLKANSNSTKAHRKQITA